MSGSSENDSSHRSGGESDCEGSAASSHESELPDTRKPRLNKPIQGKAWILRGEITTTLLHNDSASMDCDDDDEEAKIQNIKSQTAAALGATFEILFGGIHPHVKYFVLFCNLVNILHAGPAAAATEIKIQIRGFLQMGKNTMASALVKLFDCCRVSAFLSGKWERCKGGLYGNQESDCEGSAASSHESELPDTRTPRHNEQNRGRVWILRGEIATDLLHNDSSSMHCDDDQDAKV